MEILRNGKLELLGKQSLKYQQMYYLFILSIINSVFITGITIASQGGYILEPIKLFLERWLPVWLYKPLIGCSICMASIWGLIFFLAGLDFFWWEIWMLFFYVPMVAFWNYMLLNLIKLLTLTIDYKENQVFTSEIEKEFIIAKLEGSEKR